LKNSWGWFLIILGVVEILFVIRYSQKSAKEATTWKKILVILTAIMDPAGIILGLLFILLGTLTIVIR
jgi:hypothetical protein